LNVVGLKVPTQKLTADELAALETKAMKLGDYILAGHLLRDVDTAWNE
jgi:hypothetical protein